MFKIKCMLKVINLMTFFLQKVVLLKSGVTELLLCLYLIPSFLSFQKNLNIYQTNLKITNDLLVVMLFLISNSPKPKQKDKRKVIIVSSTPSMSASLPNIPPKSSQPPLQNYPTQHTIFNNSLSDYLTT